MASPSMAEIIAQVAAQTGRTVDEVKAYLADDAKQDWPLLRAFLALGHKPAGKLHAGAPPDTVDES